MSVLHKLAGQTAIYGVSSIVARFLNYLLLPLYTAQFAFGPADYGVITALYAWTAFLNVVLTYGMETTFFRFTNKHSDKADRTYATATFTLVITSALFMLLGGSFAGHLADGIGYPLHGFSVLMLVGIISIDAVTTLPMARLRSQNRPWKFAAINVASVVVNVVLNVFYIGYCMRHVAQGRTNALIEAVYDPSLGVGYVFLINLVSSSFKLLLLLPSFPKWRLGIDRKLLGSMLLFGAPLLVAGLAGMVNETADRLLLKHLLPADTADAQIGIYGACYKLAILITLFIQAFRMGAEPFFFSHAREPNSTRTFARIMNVFVAVCMSAFLLVMLFLDVFKHLIRNPAFWPGLKVVPILLLANVFLGIYYNQSVWYKVTDRTRWGGWIAIFGAVVTLVLNYGLIPRIGYMGSAWATFICYASMAIVSYALGQRYWPVPYDLGRILLYMGGGVVLWGGVEVAGLSGAVGYGLRALVLIGYLMFAWRTERSARRPLST